MSITVRKIEDTSADAIKARITEDMETIEALYDRFVLSISGKDSKKIFRRYGGFYWALAVHAYLQRGKCDAILQAGTASWRFLSEADDDGSGPTHYSYMASDDPLVYAMRLQDASMGKPIALPEMHCWVALKDHGT